MVTRIPKKEGSYPLSVDPKIALWPANLQGVGETVSALCGAPPTAIQAPWIKGGPGICTGGA